MNLALMCGLSVCGRGRTMTTESQVSESDLRKLHGMGPTAIAALCEALHERGLSFRE
jgi:hypothetical protein